MQSVTLKHGVSNDQQFHISLFLGNIDVTQPNSRGQAKQQYPRNFHSPLPTTSIT